MDKKTIIGSADRNHTKWQVKIMMLGSGWQKL